ncbi:hypothetical protein [Sphingobacterium multivorum]|uniref:hypothetical protein n=1 Tax=Sphingobacterium multivorum TaxID=28454 RepID=UPI0028ADCEEA|nr:hypothetical protein [Sphingobacterium multivorum]
MNKNVDKNGNVINVGDTLVMEVKGMGKGEVEVINYDGEMSIYDDHKGAYSLKKAIERDDIILTKK